MKKILSTAFIILLYQVGFSQSNYAIQFDGADDYLTTSDDIYTNADLDTGSMAIWFNTSSTYVNGPQMISYEGFINLAIDPDSQIVACSDGVCTVAKSGKGYTDGKWHFAVLTWQTNVETNLYIDGVLLDQVTPQQAPNPNSQNRALTFGVHPAFGGGYFDGMLDEASIWSKKLSISEINDIMENCINGSEQGLLGYWKLEAGTGVNDTDLTTNSNDLVLTNGPVWVGTAAPACCGLLNDSVSQVSNVLSAFATGVSYQWIDCSDSTAISGETNQAYTATNNGSYAVIVSSGSCADTSNCYTVTGIGITESKLKDKIIIYPNPSTGSLWVELGTEQKWVTATISDITGRRVQRHMHYNTQLLPLEIEQPAGIYLLTITTDMGQKTFRMIKQ